MQYKSCSVYNEIIFPLTCHLYNVFSYKVVSLIVVISCSKLFSDFQYLDIFHYKCLYLLMLDIDMTAIAPAVNSKPPPSFLLQLSLYSSQSCCRKHLHSCLRTWLCKNSLLTAVFLAQALIYQSKINTVYFE